MKNYSFLLLIFLLFIDLSCKSDAKQIENSTDKEIKSKIQNQNLNLSILLDVSDRISPEVHPNPTMEYYNRDIGYLNSITNAFANHMLHKRINLMNDKIQLFIEPAPANSEINDIISQLRMSFTKNNVTEEKINEINPTYSNLGRKLYDLAIEEGNYVGSDIWGFFKNKVEDYCISEDHRNIIVILTDGYIYHKDNILNQGNRTSYLTPKTIKQMGLVKSNWENRLVEKDCGYIPSNEGLDNIEVLVLGINAYKRTPFEFDVLKTYWENWLTEMGVQRFAIKPSDLPTNLDAVISNWILSK